jgi:hypothetical protein
MVDNKHVEGIEPGITAFDQVIQDIREIRANQDSRSLLHRRARSAESDIAPEESLPLFLSTSEDQDSQPADHDTDIWQQSSQPQPAWRHSSRQQDTPLQDARSQDIRSQGTRYQDTRYQEPPYQGSSYQGASYQDASYQDTQYQDAWLHDALESDRERIKSVRGPTVLTRVVRASLLTTTVVSALVALFAMEDGRNLISHASASLAAVLPGFSSSIISPAPATPQIAEKSAETSPRPVATVAVAPTREAIATAYQTALQGQPEIRQPVVAAPAAPPPPPAPAVRRLDPDELATLLKRAQGMLEVGDLSGARLLLERAADAHEAKAAFLLAQTYDPAVIGTPDARSTAPDPAAAKLWYQKAAQFGSQEAQLRLAQLQN